MPPAGVLGPATIENIMVVFEDVRRYLVLEEALVPHWQTRWTLACEEFWNCLVTGVVPPNGQLGLFTRLLSRRELFELASAVIPELRQLDVPAAEKMPVCLQYILIETREIRQQCFRDASLRQAHYDDLEIKIEKEIQRGSDMHRARVFLHNSEPFSAKNDEEIEHWLQQAPKPGVQ